MTGNLLLLDADVVIGLHKMGYWNAVVTKYVVYVWDTVASESKYYYDKVGEKVPIDMQNYKECGKIKIVSVSAEEISDVYNRLKDYRISGCGPGETECISIIKTNKYPTMFICLKDMVAIKALAYLGLNEKAISVEEVLIHSGIRNVKQKGYQYSKKKFKSLIAEGLLIAMENKRGCQY